MKSAVIEARTLTQQALSENLKRSKQHEELVTELKRLNGCIQTVATLKGSLFRNRILTIGGKAKTDFVAACREAIKANNIISILQLAQLNTTPVANR
jgi:hypothetical protein